MTTNPRGVVRAVLVWLLWSAICSQAAANLPQRYPSHLRTHIPIRRSFSNSSSIGARTSGSTGGGTQLRNPTRPPAAHHHSTQTRAPSSHSMTPATPAASGSTSAPLRCPVGSFLMTWQDRPSVAAMPTTCKNKRKYKEWSEMALILINMRDVGKTLQTLKALNFESLEVLVQETRSREHQQWVDGLKGENHFLVWTRTSPGTARTANRMIRMANADLVAVIRNGEEKLLLNNNLERAKQMFKNHPKLGMISLKSGQLEGRKFGIGGEKIPPGSSGDLKLVETADYGPLIIRRHAFITAGQFGISQCPYVPEARHTNQAHCRAEEAVPRDLSRRLWLSGFQVAVLHANGPEQPASPCALGVGPSAPQEVTQLLQEAQKSYSTPAEPHYVLASTPEYYKGCGPYGWGVSPSAPTGSEECQVGDRPLAAFVVQFFRRGENIKKVANGLKAIKVTSGTEILVNNDGGTDHSKWMQHLTEENQYMVSMANLHEIRGYNRLSKFSSALFVVFLQDDDEPKTMSWLLNAVRLFKSHPKMALLGGFRGRMDIGTEYRFGQINGLKYGARQENGKCCKQIVHKDPASNLPFMFIYKVNMGPMIVRRYHFHRLGMFHNDLSCPGAAGIGFDYEFSIRCWASGYQVGLYEANFNFNIGDFKHSGTRSNPVVFRERMNNEKRNNNNLYKMYPGFHHKKGTALAVEALKTLKEVSKTTKSSTTQHAVIGTRTSSVKLPSKSTYKPPVSRTQSISQTASRFQSTPSLSHLSQRMSSLAQIQRAKMHQTYQARRSAVNTRVNALRQRAQTFRTSTG